MSDIIASPTVRRLAREKGVDLETRARSLGRRTLGAEDLEGPAPGAEGGGVAGASGTGATGTGASGPGAEDGGAAGDKAASGTGASGPGASGPGASGPGASGTGTSGTGASGTGTSGTGTSGTGASGTGHPGAAPDPRAFWQVDHAAHGPVTTEPLGRIARIAARNLAAAQALIPAVTHHDRVEVAAIEALRQAWQPEARERGIRLTALAFHAAALARCLRDFPRFNASLSADGDTLILKDYVHLGIAVDTAQGLMVPVIRDADRKGLWRIAAEIADLAARAQARKLGPHEMGGASMTITNLGGIGGTAFTPIVNPPELAILGITRTEIVPRWTGTDWAPTPMTPLDLSYDHRVINGADAARFLQNYAKLMKEPENMIL